MAGQRILVVEDNPVINLDIQMHLQDLGFRLAGSAYNRQQAERILQTTEVDAAILDIHMVEADDGIQLARFIQERYRIPFIFLTSFSDFKTVSLAKQTRPGAYIVKPFGPEDLFTALEIACFNHSNAPQSLRWDKDRVDMHSLAPLTQKEFEILPDVFEGLTYPQIADNHDISVNTVKTHLKHIFEKLSVSSKVELVKWLNQRLK